jgi:hypothetical protein
MRQGSATHRIGTAIRQVDRQGEGHMDMARHDQIHARLGEDQRRLVPALDLTGHRRPDHLDQRMVTGEDAQRPDRRLPQGLGRAPGLVQIDDPL